ncbi:uncharacterized protein EDB93DRAFT_1137790 [Suillus bovinus]|uniref:uncharacterized protein n=1 Tax=Suillus bovinus TaxID=48563 RepID=UPI001B87EC58|nr:uncharacterized protein EDB93DRAFT_1137790 [Suillus bovinus]KAG2152655.1 hypothetical protein EDB93DRAFT_1137790 [Suillus bovinus]
MSEASFRLGRVPLTPRQVLPNIFALSVLISIFTLYAASRPTISAASNLVPAASNFIHAASVSRHMRVTVKLHSCRIGTL